MLIEMMDTDWYVLSAAPWRDISHHHSARAVSNGHFGWHVDECSDCRVPLQCANGDTESPSESEQSLSVWPSALSR